MKTFSSLILLILSIYSYTYVYHWSFGSVLCEKEDWISVTEFKECYEIGFNSSSYRKLTCQNNEITMVDCRDFKCSKCGQPLNFPANQCRDGKMYQCENKIPELNKNGFILTNYRNTNCTTEPNIKYYYSGKCQTGNSFGDLKSFCNLETKEANFVLYLPGSKCEREIERGRSYKNEECVASRFTSDKVTKCGN